MGRALIRGVGGLVLAGATLAHTAFGQDAAAGRKVANMCRTCHGLDGIAVMPVAPNIGGEPASYLAKQLHAFKSGVREQEMMTVVASGLSDEQIADVAAWFESQKVSAVAPPGFDAAAAPEVCADCHGADGIALIPEAPNLAGENTIYLDTQLKAFRSGKRPSAVMGPIAAELDDAAIRAAAEWYGGVGVAPAGP